MISDLGGGTQNCGSVDQNFLVINYDELETMDRIKTPLTQTDRGHEFTQRFWFKTKKKKQTNKTHTEHETV